VARTPFPVEVLTPEGEVFNDEVQMVSTRTTIGSIGLLANHQPLLAMLEPTELRLYTSESDYTSFAQGEGYLQVAANRIMVLVEDAVRPEDLDVADLKERLSTAEREVEQAEDNSEDKRRAERDQRRWEAFVRIAESR
jgi:F-type H+-transporting ATPase subunit epsilon